MSLKITVNLNLLRLLCVKPCTGLKIFEFYIVIHIIKVRNQPKVRHTNNMKLFQ